MSVFGELNDLLNRLPVWKELISLPARVRAIEERLQMAGTAAVVDDRPVCPFCRRGRMDLIKEEPDRVMGDLGVMRQTLKCDAAECGKERMQQREP
jgi:hypothetical protein